MTKDHHRNQKPKRERDWKTQKQRRNLVWYIAMNRNWMLEMIIEIKRAFSHRFLSNLPIFQLPCKKVSHYLMYLIASPHGHQVPKVSVSASVIIVVRQFPEGLMLSPSLGRPLAQLSGRARWWLVLLLLLLLLLVLLWLARGGSGGGRPCGQTGEHFG